VSARWLTAVAVVDLAALLPRRRRVVPLYAGFGQRPVLPQTWLPCTGCGGRYVSNLEPTCGCTDRPGGGS
jgi:hypothetical protein